MEKIKPWFKKLTCSHQWESNGTPSKLVGSFVHNSYDETNYVTQEGFHCKKCGAWKVVRERYGFYR